MSRVGDSLRELGRTFRVPTKLEWRIARRYLRSRRGARTASLNTVISTGGVAVGVTALIVVLGVMNGLRNDLRERILVANPHLRVLTYGAGLRMDDWRKALRVVRQQPGVVAAAPEVISQAGITAGADYGEGVNVVGFDPDTGKMSVTSLPQVHREGGPLLQDQQAQRGWRRSPGRPPGRPAGGLSGGHRHPGARHPGQDEPGARGGRPPVLEVRSDRTLRHRDVPVRQSIRRALAGGGPAVHRPRRLGFGDRRPGGRSRPRARHRRGAGEAARVSLPGARLADPEREPLQCPPARKAGHGTDYFLHHGGGRLQHRGDPHHGGDRQDEGDRDPPRHGAHLAGGRAGVPDPGRGHRDRRHAGRAAPRARRRLRGGRRPVGFASTRRSISSTTSRCT